MADDGSGSPAHDSSSPVLPAWDRGCVTQIIPALLEYAPAPEPLTESIVDADAVVLLLLDGLGWEQLSARPSIAPTINELPGRPITTVVPSTTSAALPSVVTGKAPGDHGLVGYRIDVSGEVLNVLSWRTTHGDARRRILPETFGDVAAFAGTRPVVIQNAPFASSGFTRAHLDGTRQRPWYTPAGLVVETRRALAGGEPFVYVYYDGIDKTAHIHGFGEYYDAELAACDRLVADLMMAVPQGTALVVTADHGLVDCSSGRTELHPDLRSLISRQSGEARFRWLHSRPGRAGELEVAATEAHGDQAWVASIDRVLDERWFGPSVTKSAQRRLGDVAVVAKADRWFVDPAESSTIDLVGRHGSLTAAEMFVPLLAFRS